MISSRGPIYSLLLGSKRMLQYSERVPLNEDERSALLRFAEEVARVGGAATLPFFRAEVDVENKLEDGRFDPVTQADKAAEQAIRGAIEAAHPEHGIYGEEFGHKAGNGLTWVIDPVDGTRAFISGFVHWGVLIGLFDGQRPVVGVMYQPFTDELFCGDGQGAWYEHRGERRALLTSGTELLSDAVMGTTSPKLFELPSERRAFDRLEGSVRLCRYGGDCYIYSMLAMGFVDVAMDSSLSAYDIQGLIPVIEGAGGLVTCADGRDASMGGTVVASANASLHSQVLAEFDLE